MAVTLGFLKRLFHFHKWSYYMGESFGGGARAWHRGCHKCGRIEIAIKTGNSLRYSIREAEEVLEYKTKKQFQKEQQQEDDRYKKLKEITNGSKIR
jgi:hypothetical protein